MGKAIITTDRLILREWSAADEDAFYAVMNNEAVLQYLGGTMSREDWHKAFERLVGYQRDLGFTFWIVESRATGDILGWCGLKRVNYDGVVNPGDLEIGWRFREETWRTGVAKEAAIASLDYAFDVLEEPFAVAITFRANEASWGLMERLGMHRDPSLDYADPRFVERYGLSKQWRIEREEWPVARAAALAPRT